MLNTYDRAFLRKYHEPLTTYSEKLHQWCFNRVLNKPLHSETVIQMCSVKKGVLKNFAIFKGKHLCWCLFSIKVVDLKAYNFIKKKLQHRRFPVNIVRFSRTPILKNICELLLLCIDTQKYFRYFWNLYLSTLEGLLHTKLCQILTIIINQAFSSAVFIFNILMLF